MPFAAEHPEDAEVLGVEDDRDLDREREREGGPQREPRGHGRGLPQVGPVQVEGPETEAELHGDGIALTIGKGGAGRHCSLKLQFRSIFLSFMREGHVLCS